MTAYDPAARFASGTGPEPRTWRVSRDVTSGGLDQTAVCGSCGAVLWRGQPCPDCKPRKAAAR